MPDSSASIRRFQAYVKSRGDRIEREMRNLLPGRQAKPSTVHEAMRYTALSGGKRLRPVLVVLAYEAAGGRGRQAFPVAAALEFVHAFSLIHDDLPCMDDDDYRRGKPSNHKVYGEGIAVLAGDALLTLAFETLARQEKKLGASIASRLVLELAQATGSLGVVGGQVLDLESEGEAVSLKTVQFIHERKTARLFESALRLGGIAAQTSSRKLEALARLGRHTGTAFQIVDDILGEVGSAQTLGRKPGGDARLGKATYPRVRGIGASQRAVTRLLNRAKVECEDMGSKRQIFHGFIETLDARRRDSGGGLLR